MKTWAWTRTRTWTRTWTWTFGLAVLALAQPARAEPSSLLRSENRSVREGNAKLLAGDAKGALASYDEAARQLPGEGGVHLNRGLALLRSQNLPAAREALRLATQPPASSSVSADAYYDLGIAFYREADAHSAKEEHEQAQGSFREAAGAFKQALRQRPGDRNAAWNYELAQRRLREQQEKQEQKKQEQKQDQQNQDQQNQDQQNQNQQNQDQQNQNQQDQKNPSGSKNEPKPEQAQKQPETKQDKGQDPQQQPEPEGQAPERPLRPEVGQALDALQDGEQNLERLRALQRAARERRTPEKDW